MNPTWHESTYLIQNGLYRRIQCTPTSIYDTNIYIYIYHQHFTTNQLPSFGPGKGCPEPIFHRHRNPEVAFVVRSFGSSSYGLWWQAETWGRDFQGRKTRDQRVLFKRKANGFFLNLQLKYCCDFLACKTDWKGVKENLKNSIIRWFNKADLTCYCLLFVLKIWLNELNDPSSSFFKSRHGADSLRNLVLAISSLMFSILSPSILGVESCVYHSKNPIGLSRTHH